MKSGFEFTKSRIAAFEQCPKRLWLQSHRPELAEIDDVAVANFANGRDVRTLASSLCSNTIDAGLDLNAALETTDRLLRQGYEGSILGAAFSHDGVLIRVDLLEGDGDGGWKLREVKSSTRAKDHHRGDLASQVWGAQMAGLKINSAAIRHIDSGFVLTEVGEFDGLFVDEELLEEIAETVASRAQTIADARAAHSARAFRQAR